MRSVNVESIDVSSEHLHAVRDILRRTVPGREVRVFGSRVSGNTKPFSDLDLTVMGDEPLTLKTLTALTDAFSESNLPWKVDVVDWAGITAEFRRIIDSRYAVLQGPPPPLADRARQKPAFRSEDKFRLTRKEYHSLRSQFATLDNGRGRHRKYLPYVFTEPGASALSGCLDVFRRS